MLAQFRGLTPPRIAKGASNEYLRLAKEECREFQRMILINDADVLDDDLTDDRLKGALVFDATLGAWLGRRSPNIPDIDAKSSGDGRIALHPEGRHGVGCNRNGTRRHLGVR